MTKKPAKVSLLDVATGRTLIDRQGDDLDPDKKIVLRTPDGTVSLGDDTEYEDDATRSFAEFMLKMNEGVREAISAIDFDAVLKQKRKR